MAEQETFNPTTKSPKPAPSGPASAQSKDLFDIARLETADACAKLTSAPEGLDETEAARRLTQYGPNVVSRAARVSILRELWGKTLNTLNALLMTLATVSYFIGDPRASVVIFAMVVLAIVTSFVQEHRSNKAAESLRAMVTTKASVLRKGEGQPIDISIEHLVPGDVVRLSAGDLIPADLRLVEAKDLFVNQSALNGEAMPVEKFAHANKDDIPEPFDLPNVCFMGANVVSGYGAGLIVHTGARSFFGQIASSVTGQSEPTAFDRGIARFTRLMIYFIAVMAPAVFVINGLTKHDWLEALLFAVAVVVGLTPEMLPMIVTVNLAKGAIAMSRQKVIVKKLGAIQDFGAMDVLCTDKTGTLTQDRIILKKHLDINGYESDLVLKYAYLNSHFQSGLKNLLDVAVLEHADVHRALGVDEHFSKVDEIPFDFTRRRLSVIVAKGDEKHILICKGAIEEIFSICKRYRVGDETGDLDASHFEAAQKQTGDLNADGFRVVAVAFRDLDTNKDVYSVADEKDLTLLGYIAFLDPPKESARTAIAALASEGVRVKILTGDNEAITRKICRDVGLEPGNIVLGHSITDLDNRALTKLAETTTVFAKLTPAQKERIVRALQAGDHVVGYMGDGINDALSMRVADVGISVDTAVDVAKESADIILLERSLMVLRNGAIEGRRIFANIMKYIRMGASSNFGNMFSVLGGSIFLPFLPMTPIQVLINNLLYDFSQTTIPTDDVDAEQIATPRQWKIDNVFRFMLVVGPISSVFDYITWGVLIWAFDAWTKPALFQTGWFVESLLTQTLIIHIIRTAKIPFLESRASRPLIATTIIVSSIGILLPLTGLGTFLGFTDLPVWYWPCLLAILSGYAVATHLAKTWFIRHWSL